MMSGFMTKIVSGKSKSHLPLRHQNVHYLCLTKLSPSNLGRKMDALEDSDTQTPKMRECKRVSKRMRFSTLSPMNTLITPSTRLWDVGRSTRKSLANSGTSRGLGFIESSNLFRIVTRYILKSMISCRKRPLEDRYLRAAIWILLNWNRYSTHKNTCSQIHPWNQYLQERSCQLSIGNRISRLSPQYS